MDNPEFLGFNLERANKQLCVIANSLRDASRLDGFDYTMIVYGSMANSSMYAGSDIDVLVLIEKDCQRHAMDVIINSVDTRLALSRTKAPDVSFTVLPFSYYMVHPGFQTYVSHGSYIYAASYPTLMSLNPCLDLENCVSSYYINGYLVEDLCHLTASFLNGEANYLNTAKLHKYYKRLAAALGKDLCEEDIPIEHSQALSELLSYAQQLLLKWEQEDYIRRLFEQDYGRMPDYMGCIDLLKDGLNAKG